MFRSALAGHYQSLLAVFAALACSINIAYGSEKNYPLLPFASEFGGSFNLVNHHGERTTQQVLIGKYSLLYFGFTDCADICPTTLNTISIALDELAEQEYPLTAYFVNLNSDNNSLENLEAYVGFFHPSIVGLHGSAADISNAAAAFGVRYQKTVTASGSITLSHSGKVFLIGPSKRVLAYFPHEASPDWIVSTVMDFISEGSAK
ncbi:MAG: SCO family protein [Halopseudomonas sp.]